MEQICANAVLDEVDTISYEIVATKDFDAIDNKDDEESKIGMGYYVN